MIVFIFTTLLLLALRCSYSYRLYPCRQGCKWVGDGGYIPPNIWPPSSQYLASIPLNNPSSTPKIYYPPRLPKNRIPQGRQKTHNPSVVKKPNPQQSKNLLPTLWILKIPKPEILKSFPQYQKCRQNKLIISPMLDTDLQSCLQASITLSKIELIELLVKFWNY